MHIDFIIECMLFIFSLLYVIIFYIYVQENVSLYTQNVLKFDKNIDDKFKRLIRVKNLTNMSKEIIYYNFSCFECLTFFKLSLSTNMLPTFFKKH